MVGSGDDRVAISDRRVAIETSKDADWRAREAFLCRRQAFADDVEANRGGRLGKLDGGEGVRDRKGAEWDSGAAFEGGGSAFRRRAAGGGLDRRAMSNGMASKSAGRSSW